ncbi:endonuclease VII domain-containing protein [Streptomyces badius]
MTATDAPPQSLAPAPSEEWKSCGHCNQAKPEAAFPLAEPGRRRSTCRDCHNKQRRDRGDNVRRGPRETPEARRARLLRSAYNLTPEQYTALLAEQGGTCALCGKPPQRGKSLVIDHCHATGVVRALLCTYCNVVIGIFENHRQVAAEYLAAYSEGNPLLKR